MAWLIVFEIKKNKPDALTRKIHSDESENGYSVRDVIFRTNLNLTAIMKKII
ncbi:Uncharacterized protein dnm_078760 [Desulfonema magnum]|uniref:Uncharacterized protein n=1 Tax=Desulfonema magnum TaxID=45655 RepID=A0A975BUM6_9BACT|nr:Uncharacterized protein dnm_078760 [Desulfonema magnum]